ncbi:hypothetical protein [Paracoccus sp. S4493]|nr:hypothetical protein [Paracoccus sp. S4493]
MADSMRFEAKSMAQQAKGAAGDVSYTAKGKLEKISNLAHFGEKAL